MSQRSQQSEFRINKKKRAVQPPKLRLEQAARVEVKASQPAETLEERRARLRSTRDAIKKQMGKDEKVVKEEVKDTRSKEE